MRLEADYHLLFPFFPRDIALDCQKSFRRFRVESYPQLLSYIRKAQCSFCECYVDVYERSEAVRVDKVVFDFDGTSLSDVFEEVKDFVSLLLKRSFCFSWHFSGRRGFHVIVFLKPVVLSRKLAKKLLRDFQLDLADGFNFLDSHLVGNVGAMLRAPNTLNTKSRLFCVSLPLEALSWDLNELLSYARDLRPIKLLNVAERSQSLLDFATTTIEEEFDGGASQLSTFDSNRTPPLSLLKELVRPCLFKEVQKSNPPHFIRFAFVAELLWLGFSPSEVENLIRTFNWRDYDESVTHYQVEQIARHGYTPPSCRKLRNYVSCEEVCFV